MTVLSRADRIVGATLLAVLIGLAAATWKDIRTVRKHQREAAMPSHTLSTVVQTSEGPTTVQTSGEMPDIILSHQRAINEAKGL